MPMSSLLGWDSGDRPVVYCHTHSLLVFFYERNNPDEMDHFLKYKQKGGKFQNFKVAIPCKNGIYLIRQNFCEEDW